MKFGGPYREKQFNVQTIYELTRMQKMKGKDALVVAML